MEDFDTYKYSINNRIYLVNDNICGCYYCLNIFNPKLITMWVKDKGDDTAICPFCSIDSVIGEGSGYQITKNFLENLKKKWFGD